MTLSDSAPTLLLLAACLVLSGCPAPSGHEGGGGEEAWAHADRDWGDPEPGGQMVARYLGDASLINPVFEQSVADSAINYQLYPYLTGQIWKDCAVEREPQLAVSWEWEEPREGLPGGRVLVYRLREDAVWSDGAPITAEDVVYTYGLYGDPAVASPRFNYTERIEQVEARSDREVAFHFTEWYPPDLQLSHTGLGIIPKHLVGDVPNTGVRSHPYNQAPVGAGPFKLARWQPGTEIVLARCEACNLMPASFLDRMVIRIIPEETTALAAIKRGSIDFMELSSYEPLKDIWEDHPELKVVRRGYRFLDYIGWNLKDPDAIKAARAELGPEEILDLDTVAPHPLFGDRKVRRALAMAVDVPSIMEALTTVNGERFGRIGTGTITPELCRDYADIEPLPHDPQASRRLLAEAGWSDSDGDGVLDKNGRPFRFTLNYNSGNTRRRDAGIYIQSMLKEIGIAMDIEPIESSVFFSNLRNKDYHAALAGWSAALFTDPTAIWRSGAEHVFNFTSYKDARVDEILDTALYEPDQEKRRAMWREMQRIIYDDQPYLFLYWMDRAAVVHRRFEDVQSNILTVYHHLHEWWVPEELRKYDARPTRN